jgi:hypothetical protein
MAIGPRPELHFQGALNSFLVLLMMAAVIVILGSALRKWLTTGPAGMVPNAEEA